MMTNTSSAVALTLSVNHICSSVMVIRIAVMEPTRLSVVRIVSHSLHSAAIGRVQPRALSVCLSVCGSVFPRDVSNSIADICPHIPYSHVRNFKS